MKAVAFAAAAAGLAFAVVASGADGGRRTLRVDAGEFLAAHEQRLACASSRDGTVFKWQVGHCLYECNNGRTLSTRLSLDGGACGPFDGLGTLRASPVGDFPPYQAPLIHEPATR